MSDAPTAPGSDDERDGSPFDRLMQSAPQEGDAQQASFTVGFRGYDKQEVDAAIADLHARIRQGGAEVAELEERHRRELEQLREDQHAVIDQLRAEHDEALQRLSADLSAARAQAADAE